MVFSFFFWHNSRNLNMQILSFKKTFPIPVPSYCYDDDNDC